MPSAPLLFGCQALLGVKHDRLVGRPAPERPGRVQPAFGLDNRGDGTVYATGRSARLEAVVASTWPLSGYSDKGKRKTAFRLEINSAARERKYPPRRKVMLG